MNTVFCITGIRVFNKGVTPFHAYIPNSAVPPENISEVQRAGSPADSGHEYLLVARTRSRTLLRTTNTL